MILTNPPLQMGETLWANQTSASILETIPMITLMNPRRMCITDMATVETNTAYMLIGIRLSVMHEPNTDIVANVIKDV
jgi:hypothetical protein